MQSIPCEIIIKAFSQAGRQAGSQGAHVYYNRVQYARNDGNHGSVLVVLERRKVVEGKSFEELIEQDLSLLADAGVATDTAAAANGGGAPGGVDVDRLQSEYLDRMPHGHGQRCCNLQLAMRSRSSLGYFRV
jgi:hypothetical protein